MGDAPWACVIVADDPEGSMWGFGDTRDEAIGEAVHAWASLIRSGDEEPGEVDGVVYDHPVWLDVVGMPWDCEIGSSRERHDIRLDIQATADGLAWSEAPHA